jgi:hypothetical protein
MFAVNGDVKLAYDDLGPPGGSKTKLVVRHHAERT